MGDIMNTGSIHEYNEFLGIETLNPLVAVIDFRRVRVLRHKKKLYGFYGICLKDKIHGGNLTYGRSRYDYQGGYAGVRGPGAGGRHRRRRPDPLAPKAMPCFSIPTCCAARALPAG